MALEQLSERGPTDRSAQVVGLLSELSERLRKAETERDLVKRELLTVRECIQDLNDRNDQTQKALLAFENKFDGTENSVEIALRRLTNMEESVDKQSTELLAILRKIEERFDSYDREYKNHAASITHFGDTLDRFDKKFEKLMQDKGRLARKLDALEFQLHDTEDRIQGGSPRPYIPMRDGIVNDNDTPILTKPRFGDDPESPAPMPSATIAPATPTDPVMGPPLHERFTPSRPWVTTTLRAAAVIVMLAVIGAVVYAATLNVAAIKATGPWAQAQWQRMVAEGTALWNQVTTPDQTDNKVATTTQPATGAATNTDQPPLFSTTIRAQMDAQMVMARKLEDNDTARLMIESDRAPLSARVQRDPGLSRPMRAIEDKAATGSGEAQHDMGALYTSGQSGVPINYDRAIFWFREAAQNGIANARYNLGVMYQQGLGLDKDMNQALAWYRSAALLEHPEARYNLGIAYLEGIGVTYNPAMAAGYFEQAARTGVVEAAYNLGLILENGLIDEPRPFEGLFWYKLAMDGGSTDGIRSFNRLSQALKLSPVTWQNKYTQMLAERPDLQALAASREKRVVSLNTGAPSVRIHRGMGATAESNPETSNGPARLSPPTAPTQRATVDFSDLVPPASTTPNTNATTPQPTPAQARETVDRQTIARIQTMLTDEGLYRGAADGLMGPATRRAIRAYQQKHALGVDGQPSTTLMAQMLARRIAGTIEPAAGDTPTAATPRTAPFRVNN